jgi:hypothetical protein
MHSLWWGARHHKTSLSGLRIRRAPGSEEVAQFPVSAIASIFRGEPAKIKTRVKATAANPGVS